MPLPPQFRRRLKIRAIVTGSVLALAFTAWVLALDRQVRQRFAGARWALPAQVYAAPLDLYPGEAMSRSDFRRELERLGYRVTKTPESAGSFSVGTAKIAVVVRPFMFWDGLQPTQ